jgi:hypothetical protein
MCAARVTRQVSTPYTVFQNPVTVRILATELRDPIRGLYLQADLPLEETSYM